RRGEPALERPDLGSVAGGAGGATGGHPRAPSDDLSARVSAALAPALSSNPDGAATAIAPRQPGGPAVRAAGGAAFGACAPGDCGQGGGQSFLCGGVDLGGGGAWRPRRPLAAAGHHRGSAGGAPRPPPAGGQTPGADSGRHWPRGARAAVATAGGAAGGCAAAESGAPPEHRVPL